MGRAIAREARERVKLEQGRVRAGQRDSDAPSYGATLSALPTARLLITSFPSCAFPLPHLRRNPFCYL